MQAVTGMVYNNSSPQWPSNGNGNAFVLPVKQSNRDTNLVITVRPPQCLQYNQEKDDNPPSSDLLCLSRCNAVVHNGLQFQQCTVAFGQTNAYYANARKRFGNSHSPFRIARSKF